LSPAGLVAPRPPDAISPLLPRTPVLAQSLLDLCQNSGEFGKNHLAATSGSP